MASGKEIRISIQSALNAAGIEATKQQVATMAGVVKKSLGEMSSANRRHWADIKAAWDMGTAMIRRAWGAISTVMKSAFKFETQTHQFKTLIGNIDEAKAHMADLKSLGDTPPFSLDEFAKASRSLMVMTNGALGYKKSLELIGDAAAATGRPIEEMGQAVGRLYSFIRDGQPIKRAATELRNMGVLTPEVVQKLEDMQKAGKSNAEIWAEVETQLGRYKGAMKETESTGEGLIGAIKSRWDNIVRTFGHAFEDTAKDGMGQVLTAMEDLEESGAIEGWAEACNAALEKVGSTAKALYDNLKAVWDHLEDGYRAWQNIDKATEAKAADTMKLVSEERVNPYTIHRRFEGENGSSRLEVEVDLKEKRRYERRQREEARLAKQKEREMRETARIAESLAEGQKKTDERLAQKAAENQRKEDQKTFKKRLELMRYYYSKDSALAKEAATQAAAAQAEAQSKVQQAWSWYRDKNSLAAQLKEETKDAEARAQFEKDFLRLQKNHRNWRTADNLSLADEAVRRVALAQEEKLEADKFAEDTAIAAERAATALEYIQDVFKNAGGAQ